MLLGPIELWTLSSGTARYDVAMAAIMAIRGCSLSVCTWIEKHSRRINPDDERPAIGRGETGTRIVLSKWRSYKRIEANLCISR